MKSARQISRPGSVKLLADLLADAEDEVTKLRALLVKYWCTCNTTHIDPLNVWNHLPKCGYRKVME